MTARSLCTAATCLFAMLGSGAALGAPAWPLQVSTDGRYLEDQRGAPFLIVADAAWCMVNGLTDEAIDDYLAARKAQGFNAIQFMLMAKHSGCAVGGSSVDRYGQSPFVRGDDDWSLPNEAYWSRVDAILEKIEVQDMLALVTPAYLGFSCYWGTQGWCGAMDAQPAVWMRTFGRFLGARYAARGNMIWIAGGDANPMDFPGMDAKVDALMSRIASTDTGHKLITGHAGRHVSAFQAFGTHSWLTLNSAYDGESCPDDSMAGQIATEYARTPVQPLLSIEQMYDDEGASASCVLDQFFWIALGGGVGHSYGNGLVWDFSPGWNGPGSGVNSPLALAHTNAAKLVRSRRFWLFAPDVAHTVVTAGYGSGRSTVAATRASSGETVMAYVPDAGTHVTVDMTKLSGTHASAYWYDALADVASPIGTYPTSGLLEFVSPAEARVLVLDDASRRFAPPASFDAPFGDGGAETPSCEACDLGGGRIRTGPEDGFPPGPVTGVTLSKASGAVRISWNEQAAAVDLSTGYDVATGTLSRMRAHGGFDSAVCLAGDAPAAPVDDAAGSPAQGDGAYYLVRARNPHGAGTYGPTSLDFMSPCP